jgi:8-oxo-dGTP diphosphatase
MKKEGDRMLRARVMATAFLFNKQNILLMKRAKTRLLAPGVWAGVGGHLEQGELNTPMEACCREILEETGITREELDSLELKYITIRLKVKEELRIQYVYFGTTHKVELEPCDEGELHWIPKEEWSHREMHPTTRFIMEHYFSIGIHENAIYTGTLYEREGKPAMQWSRLEDWEGTREG